MSKKTQESSSTGSPTANAKACCPVSRESVRVGQDYSSDLKNPGNSKSRWYSGQHASGNREYVQKVVQNIKDRLRRDESITETLMNSEKMHTSIWTRFMASSMQAALYMDPGYEKN